MRKCLITGRVSNYGMMDTTPEIFPLISFLCFAEGNQLIMVGEHTRLEVKLRISVHPSFVLNRQTSYSMTRKTNDRFFLPWNGAFLVSRVSSLSELAASALLIPRYLGLRKYFVMRG